MPRQFSPSFLSFILPAHNEELLLGRTLDALIVAAESTSLPYEIIVADDASTDNTAAIAVSRGVRVVRVNHRQIARTRNSGADASRGDTLIFVDADTVIPAITLRGALRALSRGAIGGGGVARYDGTIRPSAAAALPFVNALFRTLGYCGGCFLFCRRDVFLAAGGWDNRLFASEEIRLAEELKRFGRFTIVPYPVITSGRKLRTHTWGELLGTMLRQTLRGPRLAYTSREGLDIWYGPRRADFTTEAQRAQWKTEELGSIAPASHVPSHR